MKKLHTLLLVLLVGCSQGQYRTDFEATKHSSMVFVGVPTILGFGATGSTVPVSPTLSLTNKHVARWMVKSVVSEHPDCDLVLIRQNNTKFIYSFYSANISDPVVSYGYSAITALPVSSNGYVTSNDVKYISKDNTEKCLVDSMSNGLVMGMSGGPVEEVGKLVGVNVAYGSVHNYKTGKTTQQQFFIPYRNFKDWLNENIHK